MHRMDHCIFKKNLLASAFQDDDFDLKEALSQKDAGCGSKCHSK